MHELLWVLIGIFSAAFATLAWRNLPTALAVFFGLLPTYLVRFQIGPFPSTLLEVMVVIIIFTWIIKQKKLLLSIFYSLFSKGRAPLYYLWLPVAVFVILMVQFVIPRDIIVQFNL